MEVALHTSESLNQHFNHFSGHSSGRFLRLLTVVLVEYPTELHGSSEDFARDLGYERRRINLARDVAGLLPAYTLSLTS
jgi:hypothetical protein